jgi:AraC-like DNA-binding protein
MSVSEFIRSLRLKKPTELMHDKEKNLSEIAYETGFTSPSYFAKCFKDQFGITPSEYQQKKAKILKEYKSINKNYKLFPYDLLFSFLIQS